MKKKECKDTNTGEHVWFESNFDRVTCKLCKAETSIFALSWDERPHKFVVYKEAG